MLHHPREQVPSLPPPPILRPEDRADPSRVRFALSAGIVISLGYLLFFAWYASQTTYEKWGGLLFAPLLFVVTMPFLQRMLDRLEPDPVIRAIVMTGLAAKLLGSFARFFANEHVIGHGDASLYHNVGTVLAGEFRRFVFSGPTVEVFFDRGPGTNFIRAATGTLYLITGSSITAGYVVYSYLSFWGLYLFYRAHRIAMPDGLRRRYALLVFFMPSMVFWPSSIGKEAWMITAIGLGTYGLARLLTYQRFGFLAIAVALAAMGIVRPHVAAIFTSGLVAGFALRRTRGRSGGAVRKLVGLVLLALMAGILLARLQDFFGINEGLNAQAVFDETTRRSSQGGSEFTPVQPNSPIGLPWAIVTVMFRPFIFEANSAAAIVSALEGTLLLGFFIWNAPRLVRLPAQMFLRPFVGFATAYLLTFVYAFSAIANFGILVRQRTQLIPIALLIITVPLQRTPRRGLTVRRPQANREASSQPVDLTSV